MMIIMFTFSGDYGLESGGEESVELEIVNLRSEVTNPDRVVLLSWQQPIGVVVQFKSEQQNNRRTSLFGD